ncbi:MAG: hypothetical protein RJA35_348 [Actinomycetota bacterium]|jgi:DeoR/GlpR family transcriptional regulator of sugar metabolism
MLAAERHSFILDELNNRGAVRITTLASQLDVSEMTVRRDLEMLADQGLIFKVHGGATVKTDSPLVTELPFRTKSQREQAAKDAIAKAAAEMVQPAAALALLGGSTVFALARQLVQIPRLTIVTNSLPVSDLFQREGRSDQTVILAGGLRTPTDSFVGEITVSVFDRLNIDIAFTGAHGIDPVGGFSSPNLLEADTNRAVRARAKKLVVLADHTKWGQVAFSTFAQLEDADVLITDSDMAADTVKELKARIPDIRIASANTASMNVKAGH